MSRHAFITGAGTGIGRAIAIALAGQGLDVSLAGRRTAPLADTAAAIKDAGRNVLVVDGFDVTDADLVEAGIARAVAQFGDIAVLINCAGEAPSAPFEKTDRALWDRVIGVNLTGMFMVTQAALASVRSAGAGRIINVASTAGLTGYPYVSAYCAAKHGAIGLTRALAMELARTDITVNAVCPGFTDTPLLDDAIAAIMEKTGRTAAETRRALVQSNPQGRLVSPEDVANAVLWLAAPEAGAVTGQAIVVAGGEIMGG